MLSIFFLPIAAAPLERIRQAAVLRARAARLARRWVHRARPCVRRVSLERIRRAPVNSVACNARLESTPELVGLRHAPTAPWAPSTVFLGRQYAPLVLLPRVLGQLFATMLRVLPALFLRLELRPARIAPRASFSPIQVEPRVMFVPSELTRPMSLSSVAHSVRQANMLGQADPHRVPTVLLARIATYLEPPFAPLAQLPRPLPQTRVTVSHAHQANFHLLAIFRVHHV
jgi:hypothetical protein